MNWRKRKQREDELERELRADLELETEEQRERGWSSEQAQFAARRALGNITYMKEEVRRMWGWTRWETLLRDLRYGLRTLHKSPAFAMTAVLTLALGIGASTAVFTVVDSVLLKPLAYPESGRLVVAWEHVRRFSDEATGPNPKHVDVWQKRATAFSSMALVRPVVMGLASGGDHPRLTGAAVCQPSLFDVLGVHAILGRTLQRPDDVTGHDGVAVITYPLWQNLYQGDPSAVGKTIRLGDVSREIVGVLPPGFHFPNNSTLSAFRRPGQPVVTTPEPDIFFPAAIDLSDIAWNGDYGNWVALARLNPGVTMAQAAAQLDTITTQIVMEMPANQGDHKPGSITAWLQPMQEAMVGNSRTAIWMLMAAVMGLMLIASLNLANAQLGRAMARHREAAVRTALGAGRWRQVWEALTESLLIAAVGGAAGVLLADAGLDLFRRSTPVGLPRLSELHLDWTVLCFSLALTFGVCVVSGLLPALRLMSADPHAFLQQGSRSVGSRQSHRLRRWLIAMQVCGCTALLLITGLFSKSLLHLLQQDKGLETEGVAVAEVRLTPEAYKTPQSRIAFDDAVLANLRAIPGVRSAGMVSAMPFDGESWIEWVGRVDKPNLDGPLINLRWTSPGYFETTRQRLLAGRFFEERDALQNNAILSEGEAKALWGDESAVGGQVRIQGKDYTVIGVVADSQSTSLKAAPARMAYLHYRVRPPFPTFFLVRAAAPAAMASALREAIWKYDSSVTIGRVKTLDKQLNDSLATERFQTMVLMSFGGAALLLAMLGIYGVLSYSVITRKQEIGVRMALGASRSQVYGMTFAEAAVPVSAGVAAGLIASVLAGRTIEKLLYGTRALDAPVILAVTGLFLLSAAAAAFLPARRAASVDPMEALRSE